MTSTATDILHSMYDECVQTQKHHKSEHEKGVLQRKNNALTKENEDCKALFTPSQRGLYCNKAVLLALTCIVRFLGSANPTEQCQPQKI